METLLLGAIAILLLLIALSPAIKRALLARIGCGESFEPKDPPPAP